MNVANANSNLAIEGGMDLPSWLSREFADRCRRNPKYSLRSFARLLRMDASTVSQLLSGKRRASPKLVSKLCKVLGAHPLTQESLLEAAKKRKRRADAQKSVDPLPDYRQLSLDAFSVVSDWHHFAILDLTFVEGFKNDPAWIARMLEIPVTEAKSAISRLKRLELLEDRDGRLIKTEAFLTNGIAGVDTSAAHKQLQRQVLQKAMDAIGDIHQDEKDITSMTMAIAVEKLPEARKLITKFRRDLAHFLEDGQKTRVYNLGVQLYPVSRSIRNLE